MTIDPDDLAEYFELPDRYPLQPRHNIAPSQNVAVIREKDDKRELAILRWGLIPFWADDTKIGYRMINARAESVSRKPGFRVAFRSWRCIIPASGFYEWRKSEKEKQPYYLFRKDCSPLALAGLWDRWENSEKVGEVVETCTIITTEANRQVSKIHNRMPVILEREAFALWLDSERKDQSDLLPLLRPTDDDTLDLYPVSKYVNKPENEGKECVVPTKGS